MTQLLKRAFQEACKLPAADQNALAKWLLQELAAEKKWDKMFADSEDVLDQMADEALRLNKRGKTGPLDIDRL
jgi:hypothetical protein